MILRVSTARGGRLPCIACIADAGSIPCIPSGPLNTTGSEDSLAEPGVGPEHLPGITSPSPKENKTQQTNQGPRTPPLQVGLAFCTPSPPTHLHPHPAPASAASAPARRPGPPRCGIFGGGATCSPSGTPVGHQIPRTPGGRVTPAGSLLPAHTLGFPARTGAHLGQEQGVHDSSQAGQVPRGPRSQGQCQLHQAPQGGRALLQGPCAPEHSQGCSQREGFVPVGRGGMRHRVWEPRERASNAGVSPSFLCRWEWANPRMRVQVGKHSPFQYFHPQAMPMGQREQLQARGDPYGASMGLGYSQDAYGLEGVNGGWVRPTEVLLAWGGGE